MNDGIYFIHRRNLSELKDVEYSGLRIKDGTSIDEMKEFIYSFIKYYDTLKNELFNEKKNIFTERMKNRKRLYVQLKLI
ncbi:hypothetical protein PFMG_02116 [Plasmodium falciparum IGH-CR14]|uniref:Plasmodium RESA N-terminal domain-containing protein n=1 Tax=Plasmodium falciparum IGH-CR14 TaxID=580059 RepID=A0A0L1I890_PLAFA|nr:hypothetical protein PFMG_02116 [Plasmodium falciparum IGH-CR14]